MSKLKRIALAIAVSTAAATQALADGSPAAGAKLAQKWCAKCHNVAPDGPFKLQPPSFAAVAVYRSKDQIYGRIAYPNIHTGMPQLSFILTPDGIEDLVAYITSLEKRGR
ncbi:MAG: c-type cytochrome [Hyphomicrobiaceae bacterium]